MHYGTCENEKIGVSAPCGRRRLVGKSAGRALRVPSDAEAAACEGGDEAADGEESRVEGQRLIPVAERQFVQGPEMR